MASEILSVFSDDFINKDTDEFKYESSVDFQDDGTHWKQVGFWSAVHLANNPNKAFHDLYLEHEAFHRNREELLKNHHAFEISRFNEKINDAREKIKQLEIKLSEHKDVSELSSEIDNLRHDIQELEEKLIESYRSLGSGKKDLIQDQIDGTFANLAKITDGYRKIAENYNEVSKTIANENSEALKEKPDFLRTLRDSYQAIYDRLNNRLSSLNLSGVSYVIRPQLLGYVAALASGWFFSVFALRNEINNQDTPLFLLTGLFNFGDKLKTSSFTDSLLNHVAFVLIVLISVFSVTWFCHFWLTPKPQRANDEAESEEELDMILGLQVSTKPFLTFWIQSLPFLLILGIIFIVLSLGNITDGNKIEQLYTSLSAQTVGLFIALGFGALSYIYIINVIEPRLETKRMGGLPTNWFTANVELAVVIISMIIALILLLFGVENTFYIFSTSFFSFSMFIVCILLSAFTLGYSIYYSGLVETANHIERELESLSLKTAFSSFPNISWIINSDRVFRKKHLDVIVRLLRLLDNKTKIGETGYKQQRRNLRKQERKQNRIWRFLTSLFTPRPASQHSDLHKILSQEENLDEVIAKIEERMDERFETLPEDKEYFPELTYEIENLKGRINDETRKLIGSEKELNDRSEEKTAYALSINGELTELREKVYNWQKHISFLYSTHLAELENLYNKYHQETKLMQDGFNLALWFITSGGSPPTFNPGISDLET